MLSLAAGSLVFLEMDLPQKGEVVKNYFKLLEDQGLSKAPIGFLRQHHNDINLWLLQRASMLNKSLLGHVQILKPCFLTAATSVDDMGVHARPKAASRCSVWGQMRIRVCFSRPH